MIIRTVRIVGSILCISSYCLAQAVNPSISDSSASTSSRTSQIIVGVSGAAAVTAIMFHLDQQIYDDLHDWKMKNKAAKEISPVVTNLGDGTFAIGLFGSFIGYGLIFEDKKACEVGKIGLESFVLTGAAVQLFKHLCGRERPSDATRHGGFWHGPFAYFRKSNEGKGLPSFDSFPSGHTTTAFAAATTLSDFYTDPWVSYVSYSLATIVGISRVMESTHWISDCFVGSFIGYYGTKLVEKLNYGSSKITLVPQVDERQYGLLLCVRF